jgi:hypothetical protein
MAPLNSTQRHPDRDGLVHPAERLPGHFVLGLPLYFTPMLPEVSSSNRKISVFCESSMRKSLSGGIA